MSDIQQQAKAEKKKRKAETSKEASGAKPRKAPSDPNYVPRLKTQFDEIIRGKLAEEFGYTNPMQVPMLDKVVLNMGIGEAVSDRKKVEAAAADLALIAGQ